MLPRKDERAIKSELGLLENDRYVAEFYTHQVLDEAATYGDSRERAIAEAEAKSIRLNKDIQADMTPENLIRLGAKTVFKDVPYVRIKRLGAKDFKSYVVTEQHKQQYPESWAKYEAEINENLRKKRQSVRTATSRPENNSQGFNWQGGATYTAPAYTISFSTETI